MKLHLILLVSLFHLFNGLTLELREDFTLELRGELTEAACTGEEYADLSSCTTLALLGNPILPLLDRLQGQAFVNPDIRQLSCKGCRGGAPRGTWCFTMCGGRRRLEEGMDEHDSRRLDNIAIFEDGAFDGDKKAVQIAEKIKECFFGDDQDGASTNHPCLGSIVSMIVTL